MQELIGKSFTFYHSKGRTEGTIKNILTDVVRYKTSKSTLLKLVTYVISDLNLFYNMEDVMVREKK